MKCTPLPCKTNLCREAKEEEMCCAEELTSKCLVNLYKQNGFSMRIYTKRTATHDLDVECKYKDEKAAVLL